MNPLLDSNFLIKLNNDKNRTIYAHVISLNQYEHPIEQIEGVVTAGSVTIDGQSAVRRVCSLTLSAKNLNINNVYWGLTTKVKIEIGLQNNVEPKYDKIIWFPQGVFILTDFKTTQTVNNYTINLTGKDKGCLLNGDVSGNFPAPIRFDSYTDSSNQAYEIGVTGEYNNYLDMNAQEAILAGFIERYGSDYQYIQGQKKILSLTYIPYNGNKNLEAKIKFNQGDSEWTNLSSLLSSNPIIQHGKNTYDVNIGEFHIILLLKHLDSLTSIPATAMEKFEQLAQADVAGFLSNNLRYWDGFETVFSTIDLKLSNLESEYGKRDSVIDYLENNYVSANNKSTPMMMTV